MSLYNMLHGFNPLAPPVLNALDLHPSRIPRFRNAYYVEAEGGAPAQLAIYTRTGGANRCAYEGDEGDEGATEGPTNEDLRHVSGFLRDEDSDSDSTYATFFYAVPPAFAALFEDLSRIRAGIPDPETLWKNTMASLGSVAPSPARDRALAAGAQSMKQIQGTLNLAPVP